MEALAALSLAGTIVQFVQFAGQLFSGARNVHASLSGTSAETQKLEGLYTKLSTLSHGLSTDRQKVGTTANPGDGLSTHEADIEKLAASCEDDCNKLLHTVQGLNTKSRSGPGWWKSFHVAFHELAKSGELKALRQRIGDYQSTITTLLCVASNDTIHTIRSELAQLAAMTTTTRSQGFQELRVIMDSLNTLAERVKEMKTPDSDGDNVHQTISAIKNLHSRAVKFAINKAYCQVREVDLHEISCRSQADPGSSQGLGSRADGGDCLILLLGCGGPDQKSQEDLLRSILYDILDQLPSLIPEVAPGRWMIGQGQFGRPTGLVADPKSWTMSELQAAIERLKNRSTLQFQDAKFCFSIDGLDEYTGDHYQLCQVMQGLAKTPGIKVCVSSRPWNVFEEHVGTICAGRIRIHELTLQDIFIYAKSQLKGHSRWSALGCNGDDAGTKSILEEITKRAQGVFLIPQDLEDFFKSILASLEPFYHPKMVGTLQLALTAKAPLDMEIFCFHDLEYENAKYALSDIEGRWDSTKWDEFRAPFAHRLESRCKGLLEIVGGRVEFLHRTLSDFLRTAEMADFIAG
ncbi:hypothetical protein B0H63DRAFT_565100 [Podospora didyma]|uniref:DUF7791 domain-containing protein n=1 Tax=Podospora didyma TaxID=330526 RepID=A0AAE0K1U1_9PEZI|nr:hypothetical protein B0H63DRAFT_565100 [Podospora didyma]